MANREKEWALFLGLCLGFMLGLIWIGYMSNCMNRGKDLNLFGQGIAEWQCFKNPFTEFK